MTSRPEETLKANFGKPKLQLWHLPSDILHNIFEHIEPTCFFTLERVSKRCQVLAAGALAASYGPEPFHRAPNTPPDYRELAIERLKYMKKTSEKEIAEPSRIVSTILDSIWYVASDNALRNLATKSLHDLRHRPDPTSDEWNEAVATSLMAQSRHEDAIKYYARLNTKDSEVESRTFLAAARFGWPSTLHYPSLPQQDSVRKRAVIGAAHQGNVKMLGDLHGAGTQLNLCLHCSTAATVAARCGHVDVLEFLHAKNVELLYRTHPGTHAPLRVAARRGQLDAAQYLLDIGGLPGAMDRSGGPTSSPAATAARYGQVDILRLFIEHTPGLGNTYTPEGNLTVASVFFAIDAESDRLIQVLRFFVNEVGIDINEVDGQGCAAIHLAASHGDVNLMKAVVDLGADIHAQDSTGRTSLDIAMKNSDPVARWLSQETGANIASIKTAKMARAKTILKAEHRLQMYQFATGHDAACFEGDTVEQKIATASARWTAESMDDKIAVLWMSACSASAMDTHIKQVLDILGDIISDLSSESKMSLTHSSRFNLTQHDRALLPVAEKVAADLFPLSARTRPFVENMSRAILKQISHEQLRQIATHLDTEFERMFSAGVKSIAWEVARVLMDFVRQPKTSTATYRGAKGR